MVDWLLNRVNCQQFLMDPKKCRGRINVKVLSQCTLIVFFLSGVVLSVLLTVFPNYNELFTSNGPLRAIAEMSTWKGSKSVKSMKGKLDSQFHFHETAVSPREARHKRSEQSPERTAEALASMHLAKDMHVKGKNEKAQKLFEHALALDPKHPDILTEYGEFLESTHKNVVEAEHMYCRALVHSPGHSRALINRERTLPLVEDIDQNNFNRLDHKRDILVKVPDNHPGLRRMKKENYFKHIYHTTAIEGNTFTLSQTRSFVETNIVVGGKSIMEHNEILGLDSALSYINSTLVHRIGAITIHDILDIHKRVLGFVDPIDSGKFRKTQVYVGNHVPPAADALDKLMDEFIEWLNSEEALELHAIEFAALAHYKLVAIHPFYDGNGRTSRLLMNLILMQAGYPPVIVPVESKLEYYKHLETANDGDVRPFIRFILRCTENTLDEYLMGSVEGMNEGELGIVTPHYDDGRTIIIEPEDDVNTSHSP